MPIQKVLRAEFATVVNDISSPYPMYGGRLYPQDETLAKNGSGLSRSYKIYEDLLTDAHTFAVFQKRVAAVIGREWEVVPASKRAKDKKAAAMVEAHLKGLDDRGFIDNSTETLVDLSCGFDQLCADLMWGNYYGIAVNEVIWGQDGKEVYPERIPRKDIRRFCFRQTEEGHFAMRLLTPNSLYDGEKLPARKFMLHRFNCGGLAEDPYGLGLASKLFYPTFFKRQTGQFWLIFADKWATPTAVGKYPTGSKTPSQDKETLLATLQAISTDAGVVIPDTMMVEFLEAQRTGTINCYKDLIDFCNGEISKAVLGETGTTDQSTGGGSRARDQVGNEVRIEISKYDADLLSSTINRSLVRWITQLNMPDATPPKVWRKFPELDSRVDRPAEATVISTLVGAGYTPKREWVEDRMEVELIEEEESEGEDELGMESDGQDQPPDLAALMGGDGADPAAEGVADGAGEPVDDNDESEIEAALQEFAEGDWKLYFFEGRRTGIIARSASEARKKLKRGGNKLVKVRALTEAERKIAARGDWVRSGPDPKRDKPGYASSTKRGYGPQPKGYVDHAEPIKADGELLSDDEWDALAEVDESDVLAAVEQAVESEVETKSSEKT